MFPPLNPLLLFASVYKIKLLNNKSIPLFIYLPRRTYWRGASPHLLLLNHTSCFLSAAGGCKSSTGKASGPNALYGGAALDSRVLWAALTPRGTRHFVADTYPHDETEDHHYECVEPPLYKLGPPEDLTIRHFNIEYEDPAPLIESYAERTEEYFRNGMETLRRGNRPLVSSPTRIERPNLPPLNLQPRTLRRAPHSRRVSDAGNAEKAAIWTEGGAVFSVADSADIDYDWQSIENPNIDRLV